LTFSNSAQLSVNMKKSLIESSQTHKDAEVAKTSTLSLNKQQLFGPEVL
jgi:hypothetical protein